jgi:hypothetical protein
VTSRLVLAGLLVAYLAVVIPFTAYMKNLPVALKLGFLPEASVLKVVPGEYHALLAEYAVLKVLFYFGSLDNSSSAGVAGKPEYHGMYKTLEKAVILDPYNMDAYYFTQATFTWQLGRAQDVNRMLAYGMKYRTWDFQLPFFAGFNAAYFLHDYKTAATYMEKAAQLSGRPLFTTLAARYFYEAKETDLGIIYLQGMIRGATDPKIKKVFIMRRDALVAVKTLTEAVERYRDRCGSVPGKLADLVSAGIIAALPRDPYGGAFYLDKEGRVRTTSKFAAPKASGEGTGRGGDAAGGNL